MTGTAPRCALALDAGNSKTDIVLVTEDGTVLARTRSGPFVPHMVGALAAVEAIRDGIEQALALAPDGKVDLLAGYLANADLPIEEERIRVVLELHGWARQVVVRNDTLAMLRTGSRGRHGVAVVCGAGINCLGISPAGEILRFAALGRSTGDWGGGFMLSKEVLWAAARAEDGRGPATSLAAAAAAHFGTGTAIQVAEALHLGEIAGEQVLDLVPLLFDQARAGDQVARDLVQRQGDEIALLAVAALRRLDMTDLETDVVLGGGIATAREPLVLDRVTAALGEVAPRARMVVVTDPPVVGAALLALDELWQSVGLTPDPDPAHARIRATLHDAEQEQR